MIEICVCRLYFSKNKITSGKPLFLVAGSCCSCVLNNANKIYLIIRVILFIRLYYTSVGHQLSKIELSVSKGVNESVLKNKSNN